MLYATICTHMSSVTCISVLMKGETSLFRLLPGVSLCSFDFALFMFVVFDLVFLCVLLCLLLHIA
jgi:hypothetical protein